MTTIKLIKIEDEYQTINLISNLVRETEAYTLHTINAILYKCPNCGMILTILYADSNDPSFNLLHHNCYFCKTNLHLADCNTDRHILYRWSYDEVFNKEKRKYPPDSDIELFKSPIQI